MLKKTMVEKLKEEVEEKRLAMNTYNRFTVFVHSGSSCLWNLKSSKDLVAVRNFTQGNHPINPKWHYPAHAASSI